MTKSSPYLSVVVTARNDNHGGNLLRRMQIFVDGWIEQARRHNLSSELIVVEWNPPAGAPKLWHALQWPEDFGPCAVRFIEVPGELHRRYAHSASLPLYQMIAKNVGIRRARGRFVLTTNIDILFSDELMRFLAEEKLHSDRMYRIDRRDVMSEVPPGAGVEKQLEYCESHLLRVNAREGTFPLTHDGRRALAKLDIAHPESGITFGQGWYAVEKWSDGELFRWMDREAEISFDGAGSKKLLLSLDVEPGPSAGSEPVTLQVFERGQQIAKANITTRSELGLAVTPSANGSGTLQFRVIGSNLPVENDPRILNLRVFACRWGSASEEKPDAAPVKVASAGLFKRGLQTWRQLQGVIARAAREGPNVTVTLPPNYWRAAAAYVEWGGATGLARNGFTYMIRKRRFNKRIGARLDVFDGASGVRGGMGWGPKLRHRGEIFRRVHREAEVLLAPAASSSTLLLQVEPPVRERAFELAVKNQNGTVIANEKVSGLAFLRISIPRTAQRTEVFRLSGEKENWRLFWCGLEGAADTGGWRPTVIPPEGRFASFSIDGSTELLVTAPENAPASLYLECAAEGSAPEALAITDSNGMATTHPVRPPEILHLNLPLQSLRTSIFRVELKPAGGSLRVLRALWSPPRHADTRHVENEPEIAGALSDPRLSGRDGATVAYLHTNACGDFTLLAREKWFDLRGYPEWDLFSMNIDSVFCYTAHHGGATEEVLPDPMRIYHIEHATGSGWTPEGEAQLFARIRAKGMSFISYSELVVWAAQMRRLNCPMIFNGGDWGLAGDSLEEFDPKTSPKFSSSS